jgi:hypothetical protein
VDSLSKRNKLEAAKMLKKRAAHPPSVARCVGWLERNALYLKLDTIASPRNLRYQLIFRHLLTSLFPTIRLAIGNYLVKLIVSMAK